VLGEAEEGPSEPSLFDEDTPSPADGELVAAVARQHGGVIQASAEPPTPAEPRRAPQASAREKPPAAPRSPAGAPPPVREPRGASAAGRGAERRLPAALSRDVASGGRRRGADAATATGWTGIDERHPAADRRVLDRRGVGARRRSRGIARRAPHRIRPAHRTR